MLSKLISSHLTGQYDFKLAVFTLPIPLVELLLASTVASSTSSSSSSPPPFSLPSQLPSGIPEPGQGQAWCLVEAGKQIGTGMPVPGGRADFFEAKLEIPFLKHRDCPVPLMLKHILIFNTHMHAISSQHITGLSSHQTIIVESKNHYRADRFLSLDSSRGGPSPSFASALKEWEAEPARIKGLVEGWWVGHKTAKGTASRFTMRDVDEDAPPRRENDAWLELNLSAFVDGKAQTEALDKLIESDESVRALLKEQAGERWIEIRVAIWKLNVKHTSQMANFANLA